MVDHIVLATGYKVDMERGALPARESIDELELADGFPVLDEHFQSSLPGLFVDRFPGHAGLRAVLRLRARVPRSRLAHYRGSDQDAQPDAGVEPNPRSTKTSWPCARGLPGISAPRVALPYPRLRRTSAGRGRARRCKRG